MNRLMKTRLTEHSVCFTRASDAIGENSGIEALEDRGDHFLNTFFINGLIAFLSLIHSVKLKSTISV